MRARPLTPVNVLIALDLPALDLPTNAISAPLSGGQCFSDGALMLNFAALKFVTGVCIKKRL